MHDIPDEAFELVSRLEQPEAWLDRALLAYPDAFGDGLAAVLSRARECVLRDGDDRSKSIIEPDRSAELRAREIARVRKILAGRPDHRERSAPALLRVDSGGVVLALTQSVPHAGSSLAVRIQTDSRSDVVYTRAKPMDTSCTPDHGIDRRIHAEIPNSVWRCETPSWLLGFHHVAIELAPNPIGFSEAMLVAKHGAGRVLVTHGDRALNEMHSGWVQASVMPSGWSYLRADRTMGSSVPFFPNGAPFSAKYARVPDNDLFAICAAHSWAGSLRDSLWLRNRPDYRVLS